MAFSLGLGILHNSVRSRPIPLLPKPTNGDGEVVKQIIAPEDTDSTIASMARVKSLLDDPYAFIIDARSEEDYDKGHIPGALNVPYDRFADYYDYVTEMIPKDATIVCYCRSVTCDFSDHLAEELEFAGYNKVLIFREGWEAWQEAGNDIERK